MSRLYYMCVCVFLNNCYVYTYIHITTINEEKAMNLSERKEISMDVWESLR